MKLPRGDYPDGKVPQCFFISRESYERMLRGLVVESSDRIRWMIGTATGLKMVPGEKAKIDSVTIRLPTGEERDLKLSLVVGTHTYIKLRFISLHYHDSPRLHRSESNWTKMANTSL